MVKIAENEDGIFVWHHNIEMQGRMGIISKEKKSVIIPELKRKFHDQNEISYHITTDNQNRQLMNPDTISIMHFEQFPSIGENNRFADDRMKWVQMYFTLLSAIHNRERIEFIPLASFRAHSEGPLIGYSRAIQEMGDWETKKVLESHLQKLENIPWSFNDVEGFVFQIHGETDEELLESFFIGAWGFWLYTAFIEDPRPINLFVELDGLLVNFPVKGEKRELITFIVDSLARLTFQLNMSLVVKSTSLFPLPESLIEHLLIESTDTPDMDWSQISNFPTLHEENEVIWEYQQTFRKMKLALAD